MDLEKKIEKAEKRFNEIMNSNLPPHEKESRIRYGVVEELIGSVRGREIGLFYGGYDIEDNTFEAHLHSRDTIGYVPLPEGVKPQWLPDSYEIALQVLREFGKSGYYIGKIMQIRKSAFSDGETYIEHTWARWIATRDLKELVEKVQEFEEDVVILRKKFEKKYIEEAKKIPQKPRKQTKEELISKLLKEKFIDPKNLSEIL